MGESTNNTAVRLLIADDDPTYREWLRHHLEVLYPDGAILQLGFTDLLERDDSLTGTGCDIVLMAASFGNSPEDPRAAGLALLRKLRGREAADPPLPALIALAQEGNELTAVRALQLGAQDYIPKRLLTPDRLGMAIELVWRRLERPGVHDGRAPAQVHEGRRPAPEARLLALADNTQSFPGAAALPPDAPRVLSEATLAPGAVEAALEPGPAGAVPAFLIPGFLIRGLIGQSDTSSVYVAGSERWGEPVALKVTRTLRDPVAARQFMEREYTAITQIRSRSVVGIHDYGVHAGHEYLVMEYLPRGNLRMRMQAGLSEDEALHYTQAMAEALRVIHEAGVLHRDLKPPNVLLREDDDVALIDFGLARAVDGAGTVLGSPYYMSPEHARGEPLDERTDFYSLGIMLYEMLTGMRPYTGSTAQEVLQRHAVAPLPELPPDLSRYREVLSLLLAKNRQERFGSATQIIGALAHLRAALITDMEPSAA